MKRHVVLRHILPTLGPKGHVFDESVAPVKGFDGAVRYFTDEESAAAFAAVMQRGIRRLGADYVGNVVYRPGWVQR
jgi:hypothetical protein